MAKKNLPVDGVEQKSRKAKTSEFVPSGSAVAHDLNAKRRTTDVINQFNKDRDFESLMLSGPVLRGLKNNGFINPSPIQLEAIPNGKIGLDMIVQSKSGTGKTCVYVVVALEMVRPHLPGLQVLVLAPTREIIMQGLNVTTQIATFIPDLKVASFIGGLPVSEDRIKAQKCQMAYGTPGRVLQLMREKTLNPDTIRLVILDEADKLLEDNFADDIKSIMTMLPTSKQVLCLSATYPENLAAMAEKFMRTPQHVRLGQDCQVLLGVHQFVLEVEMSAAILKQNQIKQTALVNILSSVSFNQCLIFSNYQTLTQAVSDFLNSRGFPSLCLSGAQDQQRRLQVMDTFKESGCRILCSTDLAARGIDAQNVNLVINFDIPDDHNTYLHRIGRGGRYGAISIAISIAAAGEDIKQMEKIVHQTSSTIKLLSGDIPTNLIEADLPLLEGRAGKPRDESSKDNGKEDGKVVIENNEAGESKKPSGKIKRRGKKKGGSRNKEDAELNKSDVEPNMSEPAPTSRSVQPPVDPLSEMKARADSFTRIDHRNKINFKKVTIDDVIETVEAHEKEELNDIANISQVSQELINTGLSQIGASIDRLSLAQEKQYRSTYEKAFRSVQHKSSQEMSRLLRNNTWPETQVPLEMICDIIPTEGSGVARGCPLPEISLPQPVPNGEEEELVPEKESNVVGGGQLNSNASSHSKTRKNVPKLSGPSSNSQLGASGSPAPSVRHGALENATDREDMVARFRQWQATVDRNREQLEKEEYWKYRNYLMSKL